MNENYIVINGNKIELAEEQLRQLGIEPGKKRKNPFEIVERGENYFFVNRYGDINNSVQCDDAEDDCVLQGANYFNDESFAKQVALHHLLYRKLLKFSYDNECEDTAEWNEINAHWCIYMDTRSNRLDVTYYVSMKFYDVYFSSEKGAKLAIEEVVYPFMKEHPDFVW